MHHATKAIECLAEKDRINGSFVYPTTLRPTQIPDATGIASPCQREQRRLRADTLEAAGYIVVLTTLTALSARQVLELYQHR